MRETGKEKKGQWMWGREIVPWEIKKEVIECREKRKDKRKIDGYIREKGKIDEDRINKDRRKEVEIKVGK